MTSSPFPPKPNVGIEADLKGQNVRKLKHSPFWGKITPNIDLGVQGFESKADDVLLSLRSQLANLRSCVRQPSHGEPSLEVL